MTAKSYNLRELISLLKEAGYTEQPNTSRRGSKHKKFVKGSKLITLSVTPRTSRSYNYVALRVRRELEEENGSD